MICFPYNRILLSNERKTLLVRTLTRIILTNVTLREGNQTQRRIRCKIPLIYSGIETRVLN